MNVRNILNTHSFIRVLTITLYVICLLLSLFYIMGLGVALTYDIDGFAVSEESCVLGGNEVNFFSKDAHRAFTSLYLMQIVYSLIASVMIGLIAFNRGKTRKLLLLVTTIVLSIGDYFLWTCITESWILKQFFSAQYREAAFSAMKNYVWDGLVWFNGLFIVTGIVLYLLSLYSLRAQPAKEVLT